MVRYRSSSALAGWTLSTGSALAAQGLVGCWARLSDSPV